MRKWIKPISFFSLLLSMSLLGPLNGCAPKVVSRPEVKPPPPLEKPEKMEEIVIPLIEEKKEPERLLTFSMRDSDIREALLAIAKTLNYNIVLDPDVSGKATIEVKRVTLEEALDALLTPLGLQYSKERNFIRISKLRRETRAFSLNYITTKRTGTSSVVSAITVGAGAAGAGGGGISTTDTADLWTEIESGLKNLVSEGGKFVINKMAGAIVVTDFPHILKNVAKFLEEVEGSVQRQVMIQAKLVDVTLSDEFKMGLNWSAITKLSKLHITGTLDGKMIAQTLSPGSGVFQIGMTDSNFSALLDAMAAQGKLNILSSPKISVLNNQKAVIKVSTSEVYFEVKTEVDPDTKKETTTPTSKTVDIGVVLEVSPRITNDGQIIMDIHPIITEKVGEATYESSSVKVTTPIVSVREANSVVKVRDGQTMILAGLIQEKRDETARKVPILGDIPGLGTLFSRTERSRQKSELVVFLTPTILTGKRVEDLSEEELRKLISTYPEEEFKKSFMEDLFKKEQKRLRQEK